MTEKEKALANMHEYMCKNNYGKGDYPKYSRDPEWQKLNNELKRSTEAASNTKTQAQGTNNFRESLRVCNSQSAASNQQQKSTNKFIEGLRSKSEATKSHQANQSQEKQSAKVQKNHGNGMGY